MAEGYEEVRLVSATQPIVGDGTAFGAEVQWAFLNSMDEVENAVSEGLRVCVFDEEAWGPGRVLFDGTEWVGPRPQVAEQSSIAAQDLVLEVVAPVNLQASVEALQSEIEAVADVLGSTSEVSVRQISTLRKTLSTVRTALSGGNPVKIATVAQSVGTSPNGRENPSIMSVPTAQRHLDSLGAVDASI